MRDQTELAERCLEVENAGDSVIEYLKARGFISPRATWERLQLNELGRKKDQLTKGDGKMSYGGKLSPEMKAMAVEKALAGENPFDYLRSCGVNQPSASWKFIMKKLEREDPAKYEIVKEKVQVYNRNHVVQEAQAVVPVAQIARAPITEPLKFDGFTVRAISCEFGRFTRSDGSGGTYIDWDPDPLKFDETISMTIEEWRDFWKKFHSAINVLGVDLDAAD